ncbi:hypothetical protein OIU77_030593 [Salix suchowensis]|uniref:OB domain-containing protein n=1 Tax=Salix suchowensis TaxID=1278906 RepID=A0ABQ9BD16_9ROSI|nr:hypothetical protein OIU77_030593 [Salix suchowensis]
MGSAQERFRLLVSDSVLTQHAIPALFLKSLCSYEEQAPARIIPINALNPYQERWAIKGRVTAKGDLCCYNNAQGDGNVFYFDLLDSVGGQIRVACFNAVVDCFYDVMEVGYLISKGSLKPAQNNFNHLKNEWEIFLRQLQLWIFSLKKIVPYIPQQQFKPISEIEISENNSILDVFRPFIEKEWTAGYQFGEILATRKGQKLKEMVDSGFFPVLAVKAGKVSDFNGKSLEQSYTQLFINPDIPEAHAVKDWFDHGERDIA